MIKKTDEMSAPFLRSTRRAVLAGAALVTTSMAGASIAEAHLSGSSKTATTSALGKLAIRYAAAVRVVDENDKAGKITDKEFDALVEEEMALGRLIALAPALSMDDLAIKATVAMREMQDPKLEFGAPVDCSAVLRIYNDTEHHYLENLINASIILDLVRMSGKAVAS